MEMPHHSDDEDGHNDDDDCGVSSPGTSVSAAGPPGSCLLNKTKSKNYVHRNNIHTEQ